MFDKNAINYGLNRSMDSLHLSDGELSLLPQIESFLLPTGYYQVSKIQSGVADTISDFWGNSDKEHPLLDTSDARVGLAEKINAAWDAVVAAAWEADEADEIDNLVAKVNAGSATHADASRLVALGAARMIPASCDEGELPSFTMRRTGESPYADQAGIEETGPIA